MFKPFHKMKHFISHHYGYVFHFLGTTKFPIARIPDPAVPRLSYALAFPSPIVAPMARNHLELTQILRTAFTVKRVSYKI